MNIATLLYSQPICLAQYKTRKNHLQLTLNKTAPRVSHIHPYLKLASAWQNSCLRDSLVFSRERTAEISPLLYRSKKDREYSRHKEGGGKDQEGDNIAGRGVKNIPCRPGSYEPPYGKAEPYKTYDSPHLWPLEDISNRSSYDRAGNPKGKTQGYGIIV